jgi:hypothetical protein
MREMARKIPRALWIVLPLAYLLAVGRGGISVLDKEEPRLGGLGLGLAAQ